MDKSDIPYMVLTTVFAVAIFVAGRVSAPRVQVVQELPPPPPAAPSIVVIAPAPEPPLALLPTASIESAPTPARPVLNKPQLPTASTPKTANSSVKIESIFLEETPELPSNPYKEER